MRILHFADLHIGVENYGRIDSSTGLSTRLMDFLGALDEVVEYSITEKVDLVLLAGDTYKNRDPSQTRPSILNPHDLLPLQVMRAYHASSY